MTIDWEVVRGFVDQRQELLMELVDLFFVEQAEVMPRISKAIDDRDAGELRLYAHRLKGCLRYFGESEAARVAAQLESAGRAGMLDDAPQLLPQLRIAVDEMQLEMRAFKQEHQRP
jgi:HPt (histidine-containing phosphotransfer) domain-containing protein